MHSASSELWGPRVSTLGAIPPCPSSPAGLGVEESGAGKELDRGHSLKGLPKAMIMLGLENDLSLRLRGRGVVDVRR